MDKIITKRIDNDYDVTKTVTEVITLSTLKTLLQAAENNLALFESWVENERIARQAIVAEAQADLDRVAVLEGAVAEKVQVVTL